MPCPHCGKETDFHEDEVESVEDGSAVCLECGLEVTAAAAVVEALGGSMDHLIPEEEGGEGD